MNDTALVDACLPATEIPYNDRDEDCDGVDLVDVDGDGWDAAVVGGPDCDDGDAAVSPASDEVCDNLVDDDCDAVTDEGCALVSAGPPDPGGFYWICGPPAPLSGAALLLAIAFAAWRRR